MSDILSPNFKVADIYNADRRREYIETKSHDKLPDLSREVDEPWHLATQSVDAEPKQKTHTPKGSKSAAPGKTMRRSLIPSTFNIEISEEDAKTKKIFEELKSIPISTNPNAASVLFRVFLELSVDRFLECYDLVKGNALSACSSGESLNGKAQKVLNYMYNTLEAIDNTLSKGIRAELSDPNSILSIESLNAYVHNPFFYPKADNLIIGWDNTAKFFSIIWDCINNKDR